MKHPGFAKAAGSIERREGVSKVVADKELGYAKAHASAKAKRANPHLLHTAHHTDHLAKAHADIAKHAPHLASHHDGDE